MTALYVDANAIAKLYLSDETGQETVFTALDGHAVIATSAITYAEVTGLLARAFHDGRIEGEQYDELAAAFGQDWNTVKVYDVSTPLSQIAARLMKSQRGLRAMDALHLASALTLRQSTALRFLTFDTRLEQTARNLMPDAFA
ncbi:type II toxin-antitoxin system VapC family toxin [Deinococcus sp.]|uniref:type II toxin-antitoxin system VapC family toxin n=1 Tax=Deinococcus sp. TaxID=47478 RepID=UPI002869B021|nr:type II toxin-antitoxin system VapC family toxin [Deinococcus sp.]